MRIHVICLGDYNLVVKEVATFYLMLLFTKEANEEERMVGEAKNKA